MANISASSQTKSKSRKSIGAEHSDQHTRHIWATYQLKEGFGLCQSKRASCGIFIGGLNQRGKVTFFTGHKRPVRVMIQQGCLFSLVLCFQTLKRLNREPLGRGSWLVHWDVGHDWGWAMTGAGPWLVHLQCLAGTVWTGVRRECWNWTATLNYQGDGGGQDSCRNNKLPMTRRTYSTGWLLLICHWANLHLQWTVKHCKL